MEALILIRKSGCQCWKGSLAVALYPSLCTAVLPSRNSRSLEGNTHLKDESGRLHTPYCSSLNYLQKERSWGCGESVGVLVPVGECGHFVLIPSSRVLKSGAVSEQVSMKFRVDMMLS